MPDWIVWAAMAAALAFTVWRFLTGHISTGMMAVTFACITVVLSATVFS